MGMCCELLVWLVLQFFKETNQRILTNTIYYIKQFPEPSVQLVYLHTTGTRNINLTNICNEGADKVLNTVAHISLTQDSR